MLHDKRIRGVEIHPFDARQRISRCREVERELMGHRTFLLHHILCRRLFGKRPEHNVVRHEMRVFHGLYRVYGYAVCSQPQRVLTGTEVK